jgi:hypothetical protein
MFQPVILDFIIDFIPFALKFMSFLSDNPASIIPAFSKMRMYMVPGKKSLSKKKHYFFQSDK